MNHLEGLKFKIKLLLRDVDNQEVGISDYSDGVLVGKDVAYTKVIKLIEKLEEDIP